VTQTFSRDSLTAEKRDLYNKKACFKCQKIGHIARYCRAQTNTQIRAAETKLAINNKEAVKKAMEQLGGIENIIKMLSDQDEDTKIRAIHALQDFYQAQN
jgi:CRISPR/Cas system CSM-associated protein Csm2 small subunit